MKRSSVFSIGITSLLVLILFSLAWIAQASPLAQEPLPSRPLYERLEEIAFLESDSSTMELQRGDVTVAADLAAWSKIAFQSYRNGNWEIYLANGDGSNQTRLTRHDASDIQPRLNRGCTRIVFASRRTGSYELFSMNTDGSGLKQLTFNSADDVDPVWSPDGAKIAFQSYRDGQPEIYLMNTDGSGQTRLTAHGDYDGEPAWSPDGARIVFVSRRTGGYRIWVMNADGSEQTQLSNQPYSENPTWSPDGNQIAYDSDGDNDTWQELWLMNADGSNQRPVYDPGAWTKSDTWVRSWSPDGRYVTFTCISFIFYQNNWYWTTAYLDAWDSINIPADVIRLSGQGTDWYPDWQTTDARTPASHMQALSPYTHNGLMISWQSSDYGGIGLRGYDVQYRDATIGSWTNWRTDIPYSATGFSGTAGHTYYFRSRARDKVYNVERWPSGDGDTSTTLYTWAAIGTVSDNTDTPVAGAVVTTAPGAFASIASDNEGSYAAYVAGDADTYTASWIKSGYAALPATAFNASQNAHVDPVLPPADNVVLNWGFENGSLESGGWRGSGVITPVVTSALKHTGNYAVLLGQQPAFAAPLKLSDDSGAPQLAVDDNGTIHVVWVVWNSSVSDNSEVYYAQRRSDGAWSSLQNISNSTGQGYSPQIVADKSGAVHVVWFDDTPGNRDIYYARRGNNGIWSNPQNISNNAGSSESPQLIADENEAIHVVWHDKTSEGGDYDIYYARRGNEGTWSGPQNISNDTDGSHYSQLAVDGSGTVHVVWESYLPVGYDEIYYTRRGSNGVWSSPQNISNQFDSSHSPQLAVDKEEAVHVVWYYGRYDENHDIYYARRGSDGDWSGPQNISNSSSGNESPRLAVDEDTVVHVVWFARQVNDAFYARRDSDGAWSGPQNISNSGDANHPELAIGKNGMVHVMWFGGGYTLRESDGDWSNPQNIADNINAIGFQKLKVDESEVIHIVFDSGGNEVYYTGPAPAEQTGDSFIAQVITVPVTMANPVLSFLYRLGGASSTSGDWFDVLADNGLTATILFSTTVSTDDWTHRWFDLSPWAGQTITLTFGVHQTAGQPRTWAYLDEVTVGSAYPDLWVSRVGLPMAALPGEQVTYTLTYGNRGSVAASSVRITDTLSAQLSFVSADPAPIAIGPSLVWDVGDLAAKSGSFTIVVKATVAAAAIHFSSLTNVASIGAASPELEKLNNQVQVTTFVGRQVYLPVATKESVGW